MILIHQIGPGGYLGGVREIEDDASCPPGWTRTASGEIQDGYFAVWAGTQWEITDEPYVDTSTGPSRDSVEAAQWEKIKAERDRRWFAGVLVGEHWFLSHTQAVSEYTTMTLLGMTVPGDTVLRAAWRTMEDGVTVPMTPNLAKLILATGLSARAVVDDAAMAHKAAMEASEDPAAYDFMSTGWPTIFGE